MSENHQSEPYLTLGNHLRFLREQHSESLAEVSGAVEIEITDLQRIEEGHERPAEDILMLLINHYNMQDQEAVQLWELAGYEGDAPGHVKPEDIITDPRNNGKPVVILFGVDVRTMYTDVADITANSSGVTLQFGQMNQKGQMVPISKVGMSYEQAEKVLASLQRTLLHAKYNNGPRTLPPATDHNNSVN